MRKQVWWLVHMVCHSIQGGQKLQNKVIHFAICQPNMVTKATSINEYKLRIFFCCNTHFWPQYFSSYLTQDPNQITPTLLFTPNPLCLTICLDLKLLFQHHHLATTQIISTSPTRALTLVSMSQHNLR